MKILLINHYAGSPELGMEFRPYYMAKEWVKSGHEVLIIGATFSHLRKIQPVTGKQNIDGVDYYWVKTNTYNGNGMGRICSMFLFVFKLLFCLRSVYKSFNPDVVIASSTYPLDIFPARKIAKKCHAKLFFEVHDLWPLSPMEIGGYSKWHPFIRVMQFAENYAYKNADRVVSMLPNAEIHMLEHGLAHGKFVYIPNGFNEEEWTVENKNIVCKYQDLLKQMKLSGKKIVGYTGGHAKSNAIDILIDAMKLINNPDIACVLVGKGHEKERLMRRVVEEGIKNVIFLDPVHKNEIPALLLCMDVLYIGWANNPLYRFGISPNKLIDYMLSGKPILQAINAANDWVAEYDCGVSVPAESPEKIAEGIEYLVALDEPILKEKGKNGERFVRENLSYSVLADKFINAVK